ncbi:hypothetical protein Nepgr_009693 [Nepenthes gracilis]|uniref:IBB domain-containing protein n=1 Tax=Nepenthes gracilis TaxID=150966 RepID=A0AAD3SB01_NEPGR|nr:hypothetical protein Nepgr_009693 [Nepenthes gracilis]
MSTSNELEKRMSTDRMLVNRLKEQRQHRVEEEADDAKQDEFRDQACGNKMSRAQDHYDLPQRHSHLGRVFPTMVAAVGFIKRSQVSIQEVS